MITDSYLLYSNAFETRSISEALVGIYVKCNYPISPYFIRQPCVHATRDQLVCPNQPLASKQKTYGAFLIRRLFVLPPHVGGPLLLRFICEVDDWEYWENSSATYQSRLML